MNVINDFVILRRIIEITEAGKEVKHIIERALSKWHPHIMAIKMQRIRFPSFCLPYGRCSQVNTRYIKSFRCQVFAVTTTAAAKIKHPGVCCGLEFIY
jgi:hypothetical protein